MKRILLAFMAFITLAFAGRAENVYYNVGPFCKLNVRGNVDVVYRCNPDSTGMARYDDALFPQEPFELSVKKGQLNVRREPTDDNAPRPVLFVWSDFLMDATNEGLGDMQLTLNAAVPELKATLIGNGRIAIDNINATEVSAAINTGNGTIALAGHCREANFSMVGAGIIQADNLDTQSVDCKTIGTGTIGCWPAEKLDVHGIGTTKIYYRGNPQIKKNGGAKLYPILEVESEQDATVVDDSDEE